jgi:hypothetical protein
MSVRWERADVKVGMASKSKIRQAEQTTNGKPTTTSLNTYECKVGTSRCEGGYRQAQADTGANEGGCDCVWVDANNGGHKHVHR